MVEKKAAETVKDDNKASDETVDVDRVAMVSLKADGTPDQTEGFEVIISADDED